MDNTHFCVIPFKNISSYKTIIRDSSLVVGWLVVFYVPSTARSFRERRHPHLLSLAKDVKLGFYTVPTRNRTPGRHLAVHYTTAAPRQLQGLVVDFRALNTHFVLLL